MVMVIARLLPRPRRGVVSTSEKRIKLRAVGAASTRLVYNPSCLPSNPRSLHLALLARRGLITTTIARLAFYLVVVRFLRLDDFPVRIHHARVPGVALVIEYVSFRFGIIFREVIEIGERLVRRGTLLRIVRAQFFEDVANLGARAPCLASAPSRPV